MGAAFRQGPSMRYLVIFLAVTALAVTAIVADDTLNRGDDSCISGRTELKKFKGTFRGITKDWAGCWLLKDERFRRENNVPSDFKCEDYAAVSLGGLKIKCFTKMKGAFGSPLRTDKKRCGGKRCDTCYTNNDKKCVFPTSAHKCTSMQHRPGLWCQTDPASARSRCRHGWEQCEDTPSCTGQTSTEDLDMADDTLDGILDADLAEGPLTSELENPQYTWTRTSPTSRLQLCGHACTQLRF